MVCRTDIHVPAAAKPWFLSHDCYGLERVHWVVYGRQPGGSVQPHTVTLHLDTRRWYLTGIKSLLRDLDVRRGDMVRLTQEAVTAAGRGAGEEGSLGVVVEKVVGEQQGQGQQEAVMVAGWGAAAAGGQQKQGQDERRHRRTEVHIGKSRPFAGWPY